MEKKPSKLIEIIATTLFLEKKYVKENMKPANTQLADINHLIVELQEKNIIIKTSVFNKKLKHLKKTSKYYQNDNGNIIIDLEQIFEDSYTLIEKKYIGKIQESIKEKKLNEHDILNILIIGIINNINKLNKLNKL